MFLRQNVKKVLSYLKSVASNLPKCKVYYRTTKISLEQIFCLESFKVDFEKTIVLLGIRYFRVCRNAKLDEKQKTLSLIPKADYFGAFMPKF